MPPLPPSSDSAPRPWIILGPTAGGKSELAVSLAEHLITRGRGPAPILGADSMQVYRHLDAGTAKPPPALRARVPHHLVDLVEPDARFTVHDWLARADALIQQTLSAGGTPIVVGGTNLYLKALLEGLFDGPGQDPAFRATLEPLAPQELHDRLARVDPEAAGRIAPADRPRLTRALEVHHLTGQPISQLQTQWDPPPAPPSAPPSTPPSPAASDDPDLSKPPPDNRPAPPTLPTYRYAPRLIGLRWDVSAINARINLRVKAMFHPDRVDPELAAEVCIAGESLPDEALRLVDEGRLLPGSQAAEALGYKQVLGALRPDRFPEFADPKLRNLEDAYERTKILTRRFAKQQRTWLRRFHGVHWIDRPAQTDPLTQLLGELSV